MAKWRQGTRHWKGSPTLHSSSETSTGNHQVEARTRHPLSEGAAVARAEAVSGDTSLLIAAHRLLGQSQGTDVRGGKRLELRQRHLPEGVAVGAAAVRVAMKVEKVRPRRTSATQGREGRLCRRRRRRAIKVAIKGAGKVGHIGRDHRAAPPAVVVAVAALHVSDDGVAEDVTEVVVRQLVLQSQPRRLLG
eukprot:scaffold37489_cov68-Phaeocystis_antarctica.AAC.6